MKEKIAVVIPMYHVEDHIKDVIRGLPDWVWRVVVVDDASPDTCLEKVKGLKDNRVEIVEHKVNKGVGAAVLSGFNKAVELGATVLVKVDGDDQMPLEYLGDVVRPILEGRADYVKGNRFAHPRELERMPFLRRMGNVGLSFMTKMASGYWNVFDPTNGFIAIDASTFSDLDQKRIAARYFFETSMLIELSLARAVIEEVAMPAKYAGETSSISIPRVLGEFPPKLLRAFLRRTLLQYFVLDFSVGSLFIVAGGLMTLFGLVWGGWWWLRSIQTGITASAGTVMVASLPLILGFQLLLQSIVYDVQNLPRSVHSRSAAARRQRQEEKPAK